MTVACISVAGYRSLHDLSFEAGALTVLTGGNGVGKTNVYRALELIHAAAHGRLAQTVAREGGMPSALWAGPEEVRTAERKRAGSPIQGTRRKGPQRARLGIQLDFASYELALGLPIRIEPPASSAFERDPEVKEESMWHAPPRRPSNTWLERKGPFARCLDRDGRWHDYPSLDVSDSVLGQLNEPSLLPELHELRATLRAFRFYHGFRTDPESPLRSPQIGVRTAMLASSGEDVAAALQTILEIGDARALEGAITEALGSELDLAIGAGTFELGLRVPGLLRRLGARELSDGSLRYLALLAALYSPRPAPLLVFNEPEASLHPSLVAPLARNLHVASKRSQVWVITHSEALVAAIESMGAVRRVDLERDEDGATRVKGQGALDRPVWP